MTNPNTHWLTASILALVSPLGLALDSTNGAALLNMCSETAKVRTLAVMCHSYTNGYIDAANFYAIKKNGKPLFCLPANSKKHIPMLITSRISAIPSLKSQPATDILHKIFSQNFACK